MRMAAILIALLVLALFSFCAIADTVKTETKDSDVNAPTRVVMLGTGTPNADHERSGPALAVIAKGKVFLFDAGPGIVRRAAQAGKQANKMGIAELTMPALDKVFITHLHSDHTLGLPDLIFSPWVLERTAPINIYGPPGIAAMTKHISKAYAEDIDFRLHGLEPANKTGYKAIAHEVIPGVIYDQDGVTVTVFKVPHGDWKYAYGYKLTAPDRSIVISGDTTPSDEIIRQCNGCDVLVHEVYSTAGFKTRPPEWQKYHASVHTSSKELAELANKAKPKLLLMHHQLFWGTTDQDLIDEVRAAGYEGKVQSAVDLGVY